MFARANSTGEQDLIEDEKPAFPNNVIDEEDEEVESAEENDICLPLPSAEEPLLQNDLIA